MGHRVLGRTGVRVSPLCLGTMMFGQLGNPDRDDCVRIIHRALDGGINFLDTADVYSGGESEQIVGRALSTVDRDAVVLATKVHIPMGDDPNFRGSSRRWIVAEVEHSLRRLGTDHIDLYQVHRPDPDTAIEETLGALTDLVRQGKIRYFGCSTFPAHRLVEAHWAAEEHGLGRFVTEQPPYSVVNRAIEADVLPVAERYGMGVLPWSPLSGGWLTGKYGTGKENTGSRVKHWQSRFDLSRPVNQRKLAVVDALADLAEQAGMSMIELALGFVQSHPAVTSPIIGPRTMRQLDSQLGAAGIRLEDDVLDRIDELVPPGTTINPEDSGYTRNPALEQSTMRRRTHPSA